MKMDEAYSVDLDTVPGTDNVSLSNTTTAIPYHSVQYSTVIIIETVTLPIICLFGLVGNTLATVTFLRKPLRTSPCSLYLAARGVSDNGFLLSLFMIWVSGTFDLRLSQVRGICQIIIFMTYVCGCVSVWLCVFVSFENYFLICNPFLSRRVCTMKRSKIAISALIGIAVSCYQISLWIMNNDCSHDAKYTGTTQVLVYSDTLLTLVVPTVLIAALLFVITYKLANIIHQKKLRKTSQNLLLNTTTGSSPTVIRLPISKVAKMLFIVSLTFFVLTVPSHVIRICLLTGTFLKGVQQTSQTEAILQTIFQLIYYLSFSVNIIVYLLFGSNFRKTFVSAFCCLKRRSKRCHTPNEAVNLVRRNSYHGFMETQNSNLLSADRARRECHSDLH